MGKGRSRIKPTGLQGETRTQDQEEGVGVLQGGALTNKRTHGPNE